MRNIKSSDLMNTIFYQVPKWLMDLFIDKKISQGAFKTYVLMYDRLKMSATNGYVDKQGDVYVKYSYDEMTKDLNCSRQSVSNNLQDLEKLDLIDKKKNFSSSSTFYLKIYSEEKHSSLENFTSKESFTSKENLDCHSSRKLDHSSLENLDANNNNYNNNNYNNNNNNNKERERKYIETSLDKVKDKIQDVFGHSVAPPILDTKTSKILDLLKKYDVEFILKTLEKIKTNEWLKERRKKIGDINYLNYILGLEKFTDIAFGGHDPLAKKDSVLSGYSEEDLNYAVT